MITLIISPIILFFILRIILIRIMTEEKGFDISDKVILTSGGFFSLIIIAAILESYFFLSLGIAFYAHYIMLLVPSGLEKWNKFIRLLKMKFRL